MGRGRSPTLPWVPRLSPCKPGAQGWQGQEKGGKFGFFPSLRYGAVLFPSHVEAFGVAQEDGGPPFLPPSRKRAGA